MKSSKTHQSFIQHEHAEAAAHLKQSSKANTNYKEMSIVVVVS